ncbi:MAG: hypothetical protein IKL16_05555 [Clostridia bacterium]|nr:hypothetical protein [Clostridia bacterium]
MQKDYLKKLFIGADKIGLRLLCVMLTFSLTVAIISGCDKEENTDTTETTVSFEEDADNTESEQENAADDTLSVTKKKSDKGKKDKAEKTTQKKKTYKSGTLASAMDLSIMPAQLQSKNSVKFQSLYDFAKGKFKFNEPSVHANDTMQSFTCSEDDAVYIAEYCERLAAECANFSMKERSYTDYADIGEGVFASWGINYTGSASVRKSAEQSFVDGDSSCAVAVYYMTEYGSCKGMIMWSNDLDSEDFGMRCGGYIVDVTPGGKSAGTGLKRTSDGKYQTSDGRLSANLGKSSIIINGSKQSGSVVFEDTDSSDAIKIKNSSGSEIIRIFFPEEGYTPKTGDVFYTEDLLTTYQWSNSGEGPTALGIDEMRFYQKVNGKWLTPTYNDSPYNEAVFRVMYYNAAEGVAVFYLYTDTGTKTEMLCAVDLSKSVNPDYSSGSSDTIVNIGSGSSGSRTCAHCRGKGTIDCPACVDGYYSAIIVTPNYAASPNHHGTEHIKRKCPSVMCNGGRKDCPYC